MLKLLLFTLQGEVFKFSQEYMMMMIYLRVSDLETMPPCPTEVEDLSIQCPWLY